MVERGRESRRIDVTPCSSVRTFADAHRYTALESSKNKNTLIQRFDVKTAVLQEANDAVSARFLLPTREETMLLARERRGIFRRTIAGFCEDHISWGCSGGTAVSS